MVVAVLVVVVIVFVEGTGPRSKHVSVACGALFVYLFMY